MTLFDGTLEEWKAAHPAQAADRTGMSADRRRTLAREATLARGIHPTTKVKLLHPEWNRTCAGCDHLAASGGHAKTFYKCDTVYMTNGPATDTRLSWPACERFRES